MPEDKLILENAKITYKNFSGTMTQFNPEGQRNFCVLLDPELAEKLKNEGWNIKQNEGRMEGDEPQSFMPIAVSFKHYPPNIILVSGDNKHTLLKEEDVNMLDWAEIASIDMTIRPYHWEVNGNKGVKGYLKSMYIRLEEDPLAEKYKKVPPDASLLVSEVDDRFNPETKAPVGGSPVTVL